MPEFRAYSPQIPGVTIPHAFTRKLPDILDAIRTVKDDGTPVSEHERATKIRKVADHWYDAWAWLYKEVQECEAIYCGQHWGFRDDTSGLYVGNTLDADADRVRLTYNLTKACVDQATAKATRDAPIIRAAPGKPGYSSAAARETAVAFCDNVWRTHKLDSMYRDTFQTKFVTGTDFVLVEHDKTLGPEVPQMRPDGLPMLQEAPAPSEEPTHEAGEAPGVETTEQATGVEAQIPPGVPGTGPIAPGMPDLIPKMGPQGDLSFRRLLREQVAFDPASRTPGGQDGVGIFSKWRERRSKILEIRPDIFDELPQGDPPDAKRGGSEESIHRSTATMDTKTGTKETDDDTVEVLCWHGRRRNDAPRGNCIMLVGTKILYDGENDRYPTAQQVANGAGWPASNWPIFALVGDSRGNCPWGRSRIVDGIPLQHALNGVISKGVQHLALMANVKYVLPAGMDFEPNDEPGQVARVSARFWTMTGGHPVQTTTIPQMTPEYMNAANYFAEALQLELGVSASSMGSPPTAQPSGRLAQQLIQSDDSRMATLKRAHDNDWSEIMQFALELIQRNWTGKRQLMVVGEDHSVSLRFFDVADIAAGTTLYCVNDTSLPRDPQQRALMLSNVMQMVQMAPTEDGRRMALELVNVPDIQDFLRRASPHQMRAVDVCRMLLLGEGDGSAPPPPQMDPMTGMVMPSPFPPNTPLPQPWDNAMIFKAEIERFGLSREYLDRVKAEKGNAAGMGQSPLEQRTVALWTYYSQQVNAIAGQQAAAMRPPTMPGQAPGQPPGKPAPGESAPVATPASAAA